MPDCPEDAELVGFLNESLPGERLGPVSGHVDGCARCQERLDRLTEQAGGAVARLRELSSGVLPDSRSGAGAEENTLVLGARPPVHLPAFAGLPRVPGFDVLGEIGRGGMGVVYKARHQRLNRLVALKMILAGTAADPRNVQRFMFEAEVLARIQHPQVVQVFEVDTYQAPSGVPIPYLAMELLEGGSLSRKLREGAGVPRWPSPRVAAELVEGLARAVHTAHLRGVIHRDLKPGNILFPVESPTAASAGPGALCPKVMDFGLAKFTREVGADLTQSGQVIGTPQYMAPEQAAGGRDIGPGADVYALGAILFECLAGRPPFTGADPVSVLLKVVNEAPADVRALRPELPRDLAAVTMRCLEKDPARRYSSAETLADDLQRFLDDRPTRARPVRGAERLWLWAKRNPTVAGLLAALAVVLVSAFVIVAALWVRAEQKARAEAEANSRLEWAEGIARAEARTAGAALLETERQKALLEFGRAVTSCEEGRVTDGLALFVRAAELAERTGERGLAHAARINLAAWVRDLPPVPRPLPHARQPRFAAFHPDGKRLVTAGHGGEVYLWDIGAGAVVRAYKPSERFRVPGEKPTYWTVAISPDGNTVAAGGTDRAVTLWHLESAEPFASFVAVGTRSTLLPFADDGNVWSLGFTSNTVLWSNDDRDGLKRWDLTAVPEPRARPVAPNAPIEKDVLQILVVSADGRRIYTGSRAGVVREWDAEQGVERRAWRVGGWIADVAVSADGAGLAATGPDGVVWLIDIRSEKAEKPRVLPISLAGAYGNGVAFAPGRPHLVTSDGDGNVRFWHRETGQPIGLPLRFHGEVARPRFRPNADVLAVPAGNAVFLSGLPDPPGTLISAGHGSRIRGLGYAPAGDRLGAADDDAFELFDARTGKRVQEVRGEDEGALALHFDPVRPVVYRGTRVGFDRVAIPDGRKSIPVSSYGLGRVLRIDAPRGGDGLFVLGGVVVARYDPVKLRPVVAERPAGVPPGVKLNALAVRPDGGEVLVSFADRVVFLHPDTLKPLRDWRVGDELLDARYTPDGTKVLVGRCDNRAELLDAATGAPTAARAMPHTRAVAAVAVSPDGTVLLTGSRDGTARFWDAATGLPLGAPLRHTGPVTHVAFAPGGARVATGTDTGHVMTWDVPPPATTATVEELRAQWEKRE
jgi:serine/threonine protein kinase/WD40 repeat protein